MGLNDNFAMPADADDIEAAIAADLERFRAELPDARLVVVEPFWHQDERPESVAQIIGWVEAAAERVGADYIAGASRWIEGHPEWMSSDTIHPNDDGYAEIARRMDEELERLGLSRRRVRSLSRRSPASNRRKSPSRSSIVGDLRRVDDVRRAGIRAIRLA